MITNGILVVFGKEIIINILGILSWGLLRKLSLNLELE